MAALKGLFHHNILQEYWYEFKFLITLVHLPKNHKVSYFLSVLKPKIQYSVRMFQPQTLQHALALEKLQGNTLNTTKNPNKFF